MEPPSSVPTDEDNNQEEQNTPSRDDLLVIVERSRHDLDAAIDGLDDTAMAVPGVVGAWSIIDIIGHVTAWEQVAAGYLEQWRRGEPPMIPDWVSVDEFNAREAAKRHGWSIARVQEEAANTHRHMLALIASITDDEWATPVTIREHEQTIGAWICGALNGDGPGTHAAEHARQIQNWRASRASPTTH